MQALRAALPVATALLAPPALAQKAGTVQPEMHPSMAMEECSKDGCSPTPIDITLDMSWRWLHCKDGYTNCIDDETGMWKADFCTDPDVCAETCVVEGISNEEYSGTYGVSADDDSLRLNYIPGSRVYALEGDGYKMFKLKNREFSVEVDVSSLACGINAAVYFVEMPSDGGAGEAGAHLGAGYCDAQCPRHLTFVDGLANTEGWAKRVVKNPEGDEVEVGPEGRWGSCCAEMDIFEANREAAALTVHPCSFEGVRRCDGSKECGDKDQEQPGWCDSDGCGYNPYRLGAHKFYGQGEDFDVDTSKPLTLVTQFLTDDGTDDGQLQEIRRIWLQDGMIVRNSDAGLLGSDAGSSITDELCSAQAEVFNTTSASFADMGSLKAMGDALGRGVVLAMSIWDDSLSRMVWLDAEETTPEEKGKLGAARGPCDFSSGDAKTTREDNADAFVVFSKLRVGEINTTFQTDLPVKEPKAAMTVASTTTTTTKKTTTTETITTTSTKTTTKTTTRTSTKTTTKTTKTTTKRSTTKLTTTKRTTTTKPTTKSTTEKITTRIATTTKVVTTTLASSKTSTTVVSSSAPANAEVGACASLDECFERAPGRGCQCDPGCVAYGDCCEDALKACLAVWTTIAEGVTFGDAGHVSDQGAASGADRGLEDSSTTSRATHKRRSTTKLATSTSKETTAAPTTTRSSTSRTNPATTTPATTASSRDKKSSISTTKAATTTSATKTHSHDKKRRRHKQATAGSEASDSPDGNATAEAEAPNGSAPAEGEVPFCCLSWLSKDDVCGTCWPSARLEAGAKNWCARNQDRCEGCGKVWCGQGEATPSEVGLKSDSGNGTDGSCATYGCGSFSISQECQCNKKCVDYDDCCPDAEAECDPKEEIVMKSLLVRPVMRGSATAKASSYAPLAAALAVTSTGLAVLVLLARDPSRGARLLPRYEQLEPSAERAFRQPLTAPASVGLARASFITDPGLMQGGRPH